MEKYSTQELIVQEYARLTFLLNRDGLEGMISFAKRGFVGYGSVIKETKGILTRQALVASRIVYRRVLMQHQEYLSIISKGEIK